MCGIAGWVDGERDLSGERATLEGMAQAVRHRGPDGFGYALDAGAGLINTRLSIFDLPGGWQPQVDPAGGMIVYNGEVYNHYELRRDLEARGETFRTTSDTEVVLRLLEREGTGALDRLNGQFALAWWQPGPRRLTLVRDRFGVRPLHYALKDDGTLIFGSEAKAIFASGEVKPEPRPARHRRRLHALGPASTADRLPRRQPSPAGRGAGLGGGADRRGTDLVDPVL